MPRQLDRVAGAKWRPGVPAALALVALCCAGGLIGGCAPVVGDPCTKDSECGTGLTCDAATPEGYCTKLNCKAGECPPEAACIDFGTETTWCMRTCGPDEECRSGLVCRDDFIGKPGHLDGTEHAFCGVEPPAE